jgi:hypothetical protein|tara:strand:+ start:1749 stop:2390 length:642 start_codon:yes stop_codon:yes gene_type:complete
MTTLNTVTLLTFAPIETIFSDYFKNKRSFDKSEARLESSRGALAAGFIDLGMTTKEHFVSPYTNDASLLSKPEWAELLNLATLVMPAHLVEMLPAKLSNGVAFELGTKDTDDYAKKDPIRKQVLDAGRQPASIVGDLAKIVLGRKRPPSDMTEEEIEVAAEASEYQKMTEAFTKWCRKMEKGASEAHMKDVSKAIQTIRLANAKHSELFNPSH